MASDQQINRLPGLLVVKMIKMSCFMLRLRNYSLSTFPKNFWSQIYVFFVMTSRPYPLYICTPYYQDCYGLCVVTKTNAGKTVRCESVERGRGGIV